MNLFDRAASRLTALRRMYSIYCELGYIPWKKAFKVRKRRKKDGVYMGGRELIPFMNDDAKRTVSHLLLRPGYMMRDYVVRGDHENYLAPLTALLVFYSVFTLLMAIVQPGEQKRWLTQDRINALRTATFEVDSTSLSRGVVERSKLISNRVADLIVLTNMDLYPEEADKPWEQSLAAFESNLRSKGVPTFLWGFLSLWFLLWLALRKRKISFSGAAAISAYVMCQFCVVRFLVLLLTWKHQANVDLLIYAALLTLDYHQLLGLRIGKAFRLALRTGLRFVLYLTLLFILVIVGLSLFAFMG